MSQRGARDGRAGCRGTDGGLGGDSGAVAILVAILVPLFLVLCGISVDLGRWYVEAQRVQNAADAAAMAGVTWLPQNSSSAFSTARTVASINGYPNSGSSSVVTMVGGKPSQLLVTVTSTIGNAFGRIFGRPTTTITRAAMADYAAPAIMGSPCNALGNQPPSSSGAAQPIPTVIPSEAQGGYAACQITPAFWMNIAGPATNKVSGDRYATKTNCGTGVDLCTSGTNDEYDPDGYVFVVRVQPSAVNQQIDLQLYDPAFIYTNDTCTAAPTRTSFTVNRKALASNVATLTTSAAHGFAVGDVVTVSGVDATFNGTFSITAVTSTTFSFAKTASNVTSVAVSPTGSVTLSMTNPYAPTAADAAARYALDTSTSANAKTFCPGDQMLNSGTYLNTSFVLREQTDSLDPSKAVPIDACTKQYASLRTGAPNDNGNLTGPTAAQLTQGSAKYDASLAQLFHQWVDFCSFIPNRPGDYYLQVRTNVRLVGAKTGNYIYSGISNGNQVANPATLDESGSGHNRFAIRAYVSNTAAASQVSVAGWQQMSIYTNASAASSTFNLVQVLPNSAGNSFNFEAYDNGDATCPNRGDCKLQVSLPFDAYATDGGSLTMGGCVGTGPETTPYTNPCTFNVSGNNGRVQIITVPIPTNYGCDEASPGGCWFRVTASFPSAVSDTVTYGTEIIEDPVRLIQ